MGLLPNEVAYFYFGASYPCHTITWNIIFYSRCEISPSQACLIGSKVISASDIATLEAYSPCPDNSPFIIMTPASTAISFIHAIISFNSIIVTSLLPLCLIRRIWKYSRRLQIVFVKRPENVNREERQFEKETKYSENLIIHAWYISSWLGLFKSQLNPNQYQPSPFPTYKVYPWNVCCCVWNITNKDLYIPSVFAMSIHDKPYERIISSCSFVIMNDVRPTDLVALTGALYRSSSAKNGIKAGKVSIISPITSTRSGNVQRPFQSSQVLHCSLHLNFDGAQVLAVCIWVL